MRRGVLLAFPILLVALILQTSIISRINLLSGFADIILLIVAAWALQERVRSAWVWGIAAGLMVGLVSGIPWYIYLAGYLAVVAFARLLTRRIWQAPLLAMFAVTFVGTLLVLGMMFVQRTVLDGVSLALGEAFSQIILPSLLLNLLLAVPVRSLIHDLAERVYPEEGFA